MAEDEFGFTIPSEAKTGDRFDAKDHMGNLVAFFDHNKDTFTHETFGDSEIAVCGLIVVMDSDEGPEVFRDAWVFGKAMAPTINGTDGTAIGVIGTKDTKFGNPAVILEDPTKTQLKAARKWAKKFLEKNTAGEWNYVGEETDPNEAPF